MIIILTHRYVPEVSALSSEDPIEIDAETKDLLKSLGMDSIPVTVTNVTSFAPKEKKGRYVPGSGRN
jgi:small subunit ribosomal protein S17e